MDCPKWSKDEGKYVFEQKMFKVLLTLNQYKLLIRIMNNEVLQLENEVKDFPESKDDLKTATQLLNKL